MIHCFFKHILTSVLLRRYSQLLCFYSQYKGFSPNERKHNFLHFIRSFAKKACGHITTEGDNVVTETSASS